MLGRSLAVVCKYCMYIKREDVCFITDTEKYLLHHKPFHLCLATLTEKFTVNYNIKNRRVTHSASN